METTKRIVIALDTLLSFHILCWHIALLLYSVIKKYIVRVYKMCMTNNAFIINNTNYTQSFGGLISCLATTLRYLPHRFLFFCFQGSQLLQRVFNTVKSVRLCLHVTPSRAIYGIHYKRYLPSACLLWPISSRINRSCVQYKYDVRISVYFVV